MLNKRQAARMVENGAPVPEVRVFFVVEPLLLLKGLVFLFQEGRSPLYRQNHYDT